jgi:hypothetical protein
VLLPASFLELPDKLDNNKYRIGSIIHFAHSLQPSEIGRLETCLNSLKEPELLNCVRGIFLGQAMNKFVGIEREWLTYRL